MCFLLHWATQRTANVLDSHTLVCASPHASAVHGRRVTGCKPNNMRLGWDEGNRLANVTLGLTGMIPSKETTWAGVTPTFPLHLAWNFTLMAMQVGANAADVVTSEVSVRGFNMELNNGISHGPLTYYYDDAGVKIEGPASVDEGTHKVTGSFTIKKMDADWLDRFYGQTECSIRLLGFHPGSAVTLSTTGSFITSSGDATINVADPSDFEAGDVVYLEDSTAADRVDWIREALYVTAVNESALSIEVDTDGDDPMGESIGRGQTFTVGSRIYSKGIQLYIRDFVIKNREDEGGPTDQIYERIDFEAEASSTFDPLGWLVR